MHTPDREAHAPHAQPRDSQQLLTLADVARITGTSERFARRLIQERRLPTVKVGRYVRVWPADLDAYLAAQTRPANPLGGAR